MRQLRWRSVTRAVAAGGAAVLLATGGLEDLARDVLAHGPDPVLSMNLYSQSETLTFRWDLDAAPPTAVKNAVIAAANEANNGRAARTPTFLLDAAGTGEIAYGGAVPCGVNGIACMHRDTAAHWFGVWFRPHGTVFDWGTLRWCQVQSTPTDGCFDLEDITLDELGHVLVLDHHDNFANESDYGDAVVQTVSHARPKTGWNTHAFGRCDIATLQRQYDVLSWATPYSTCLDIPTTVTITANTSSVAYGGTAMFTATLKTADGYGRLSLNPLDVRTVVLQRRAGANTWTDIAIMGPGGASGVYISSQFLRSTGDWRVVFRKPSTEGLRAATSPTVTVTAGACTSGQCPLSAPHVGQR